MWTAKSLKCCWLRTSTLIVAWYAPKTSSSVIMCTPCEYSLPCVCITPIITSWCHLKRCNSVYYTLYMLQRPKMAISRCSSISQTYVSNQIDIFLIFFLRLVLWRPPNNSVLITQKIIELPPTFDHQKIYFYHQK